MYENKRKTVPSQREGEASTIIPVTGTKPFRSEGPASRRLLGGGNRQEPLFHSSSKSTVQADIRIVRLSLLIEK